MHFSASRSLTQPLLGCILYPTLTQYPYDPGTLPSSANQCILGNVYLRSNLSRKRYVGLSSQESRLNRQLTAFCVKGFTVAMPNCRCSLCHSHKVFKRCRPAHRQLTETQTRVKLFQVQIRSNMQICGTHEFHGTVATVGS